MTDQLSHRLVIPDFLLRRHPDWLPLRHPGPDLGSMACKGDGPRVFARGDKVRVFARGDKVKFFARGDKVEKFASRGPKPRAIPEFGNTKDPVQHSQIVQNHGTPQDASNPSGVTLARQTFAP